MKRLSKRQKTALLTLPIAIGAMVAAWMLLPERYFFFFFDWWLHPSNGLGMVCGVSEQEEEY